MSVHYENAPTPEEWARLYTNDKRLRAVNAKLLSALEAMIASSDAIAHATPAALDSLPNARELHLADVTSRNHAREAIEEARK